MNPLFVKRGVCDFIVFFFSTMSERLASLFCGIILEFNKKVFSKRVLD
ncbi:outer membrane HofA domain protein [Helicobacter pylori NQ4110]|nr:outer membrane HofA domain protein [Helicobacter pylori NQ4110]